MRLLSLLLAPLSLFCGVHLINDSPYTLRAVIQGYDGTYLGEVIVQPQHMSDWSDSYGTMGRYGPFTKQPNTSRVPYTVLWYCLLSDTGDEYSICTNVATGATITAQSCDGRRMCKGKKKDQNPNPQPGYLDETNALPAPPPDLTPGGFPEQEQGRLQPGQ